MPLEGGDPTDGVTAVVGQVFSVHRSPEAWALLLQTKGKDATGEAFTLAAKGGFLPELTLALVEANVLPPERNAAALAALVQKLGAGLEERAAGRMQALLTQDARLSDASVMLPALMRTGRACAEIRVRVPPDRTEYGTGFLVGDDLLLTAGHVVSPLVGAPPDADLSGDRIEVRFPNRLDASEERWPKEPIRATPQGWRVFWSRPAGAPPVLGDADEDSLDCALIRLAEPAPDVVPRLDILAPPPPDDRVTLHVMGHLMGGRLSFDHGLLRPGGCNDSRVRHLAATVEGMSGGPCLDSAGRLLALHEGTANRPDPEHNRGIALHWVRKAMRRSKVDPLDTLSRSWVIDSRDAVHEMASRLGEAGDGQDTLHPVLGRPKLRAWLTPGSAESMKPILLISGDPGMGKTFTGHLLRAWLPVNATALAWIPPEVVRQGDDQEIVARCHAALGRVVEPTPPRRRAAAGTRLYDVLLPALDAWELRLRSGTVRRLVIFADLGVPDTWALAPVKEFWSDLLRLAVARREWLRLAIAGIGRDVAIQLLNAIGTGGGAATDDVLSETLPELDWDDNIWPTASEVLRTRRKPADGAAQARLVGEWHAGLPAARENRAAHAARFVRGL